MRRRICCSNLLFLNSSSQSEYNYENIRIAVLWTEISNRNFSIAVNKE